MFDHSGGRGRVFFHPAFAQEVFSPVQNCESISAAQDREPASPSTNLQPLKATVPNPRFKAYKEMVAGAFTSLQTLRSARQHELESLQEHISNHVFPDPLALLEKPRVSEAIVTAVHAKAPEAAAMAQTTMASETLACQGKSKVFVAPLPAPMSCRFSQALTSSKFLPSDSRRQLSGTKQPAETASSESMRENTEDLDALLSSDEEDDEEVRSTGHSPDKSSEKEESCNGDEDDEVQLYSSKRRRVDEQQREGSSKEVSSGEEVNDKRRSQHHYQAGQSNRRQKIKTTVKALRKMIPGGAFLDAGLVLDETILYVKALCNRVNQLEATRFQPHP